jgi:hypothetical protein
MTNRFKKKLQGSGKEILNSGKINIESNELNKNEMKSIKTGIGNNSENISDINENKKDNINVLNNSEVTPSYIANGEYLMWKMAKPDKSLKGKKYQLNITVSEENLKKQMALEYKLGLNRHKMSELPNKAMNILYDIVHILDGKNDILDLSTEQILNLVTIKLSDKVKDTINEKNTIL